MSVRAQSLRLCLTYCNSMDCSLPGSSVHGILQARILERVAIPFSRGSSWPRDWPQVSCIAGGFFTIWATRETLCQFSLQVQRKSPKTEEVKFCVPTGCHLPALLFLRRSQDLGGFWGARVAAGSNCFGQGEEPCGGVNRDRKQTYACTLLLPPGLRTHC